MNDIRIIVGSFLVLLTLFGLLVAKAFAFSYAWILYPAGIISIPFLFICVLLGFYTGPI